LFVTDVDAASQADFSGPAARDRLRLRWGVASSRAKSLPRLRLARQ
jgi:hypothetical protein